jgi:hypothetical protein
VLAAKVVVHVMNELIARHTDDDAVNCFDVHMTSDRYFDDTIQALYMSPSIRCHVKGDVFYCPLTVFYHYNDRATSVHSS